MFLEQRNEGCQGASLQLTPLPGLGRYRTYNCKDLFNWGSYTKGDPNLKWVKLGLFLLLKTYFCICNKRKPAWWSIFSKFLPWGIKSFLEELTFFSLCLWDVNVLPELSGALILLLSRSSLIPDTEKKKKDKEKENFLKLTSTVICKLVSFNTSFTTKFQNEAKRYLAVSVYMSGVCYRYDMSLPLDGIDKIYL